MTEIAFRLGSTPKEFSRSALPSHVGFRRRSHWRTRPCTLTTSIYPATSHILVSCTRPVFWKDIRHEW